MSKDRDYRCFRYGLAAGFVLVHIGAVLSLWFVSISGVVLCGVLAVSTQLFGIAIGYHRLLAHGSFVAGPTVRTMLALLGVLSLQAGPLRWVALHRVHHRESDEDPDPHSPLMGFLWAHMLWFLFNEKEMSRRELQLACPDLYQHQGLRFLEKWYWSINVTVGVVLFGIGFLKGGTHLGLSWLTWGGCCRLVYVWHTTFLVNSATHLWGYRRYETGDNSRNNWWVALLTYGEGWHNNHHADPRSAAAGHVRDEVDLAFFFIRVLEYLGLAWHVILPKAKRTRRGHSSTGKDSE